MANTLNSCVNARRGLSGVRLNLRLFRQEYDKEYRICRKRYLLQEKERLWEEISSIYDTIEHEPEAYRVRILRDDANKLTQKHKKITNELKFVYSDKTPTVTDEDIAHAKQVHLVEAGILEGKRSGRNYTAKCLWHEEKTPSMVIYPDGVHCFGCQKHADPIEVVQEVLNINFIDAVKHLRSL